MPRNIFFLAFNFLLAVSLGLMSSAELTLLTPVTGARLSIITDTRFAAVVSAYLLSKPSTGAELRQKANELIALRPPALPISEAEASDSFLLDLAQTDYTGDGRVDTRDISVVFAVGVLNARGEALTVESVQVAAKELRCFGSFRCGSLKLDPVTFQVTEPSILPSAPLPTTIVPTTSTDACLGKEAPIELSALNVGDTEILVAAANVPNFATLADDRKLKIIKASLAESCNEGEDSACIGQKRSDEQILEIAKYNWDGSGRDNTPSPGDYLTVQALLFGAVSGETIQIFLNSTASTGTSLTFNNSCLFSPVIISPSPSPVQSPSPTATSTPSDDACLGKSSPVGLNEINAGDVGILREASNIPNYSGKSEAERLRIIKASLKDSCQNGANLDCQGLERSDEQILAIANYNWDGSGKANTPSAGDFFTVQALAQSTTAESREGLPTPLRTKEGLQAYLDEKAAPGTKLTFNNNCLLPLFSPTPTLSLPPSLGIQCPCPVASSCPNGVIQSQEISGAACATRTCLVLVCPNVKPACVCPAAIPSCLDGSSPVVSGRTVTSGCTTSGIGEDINSVGNSDCACNPTECPVLECPSTNPDDRCDFKLDINGSVSYEFFPVGGLDSDFTFFPPQLSDPAGQSCLSGRAFRRINLQFQTEIDAGIKTALPDLVDEDFSRFLFSGVIYLDENCGLVDSAVVAIDSTGAKVWSRPANINSPGELICNPNNPSPSPSIPPSVSTPPSISPTFTPFGQCPCPADLVCPAGQTLVKGTGPWLYNRAACQQNNPDPTECFEGCIPNQTCKRQACETLTSPIPSNGPITCAQCTSFDNDSECNLSSLRFVAECPTGQICCVEGKRGTATCKAANDTGNCETIFPTPACTCPTPPICTGNQILASYALVADSCGNPNSCTLSRCIDREVSPPPTPACSCPLDYGCQAGQYNAGTSLTYDSCGNYSCPISNCVANPTPPPQVCSCPLDYGCQAGQQNTGYTTTYDSCYNYVCPISNCVADPISDPYYPTPEPYYPTPEPYYPTPQPYYPTPEPYYPTPEPYYDPNPGGNNDPQPYIEPQAPPADPPPAPWNGHPDDPENRDDLGNRVHSPLILNFTGFLPVLETSSNRSFSFDGEKLSKVNWLKPFGQAKTPELGFKASFPSRLALFQRADGFLAYDFNGNGIIDDGTELFGNHTLGLDLPHGYLALAGVKDKNLDGKITGAELAGLLYWVDFNSDAKCTAAELISLNELGIVELDAGASLTYDRKNLGIAGFLFPLSDSGALVSNLSSNYKVVKSYDLWFNSY